MLGGLPADFPAAVLVVTHVLATGGRSLPYILDRAGPLEAASADDGEPIRPGRVYVAPPDRHLLVVRDSVRLSRGPRYNGLRPAADPLFGSAALYAGPRTVAVVLSGALDDAALGSATVERRGGLVLVQDPAQAAYDSMPRSVVRATANPAVAPVAELASEVIRLTAQEIGTEPPDTGAPDQELAEEIGGLLEGAPETNTLTRDYTGLSCPDCGGPLYATFSEKAETYDCLVGHRWSPESLFEGHSAAVERAMWLAIRSLDERGRLAARLADGAQTRGHELSARQFAEAAQEARHAANVIREAIAGMSATVAPDPDPA